MSPWPISRSPLQPLKNQVIQWSLCHKLSPEQPGQGKDDAPAVACPPNGQETVYIMLAGVEKDMKRVIDDGPENVAVNATSFVSGVDVVASGSHVKGREDPRADTEDSGTVDDDGDASSSGDSGTVGNDTKGNFGYNVQDLDDQRQELPMGVLKKLYSRMLFILTRCTRLLQFHKESGFAEDEVVMDQRDKIIQSADKQDFSSIRSI